MQANEICQFIRDVCQFDDVNTVRGAWRTPGFISVEFWTSHLEGSKAEGMPAISLKDLVRVAEMLCLDLSEIDVAACELRGSLVVTFPDHIVDKGRASSGG